MGNAERLNNDIIVYETMDIDIYDNPVDSSEPMDIDIDDNPLDNNEPMDIEPNDSCFCFSIEITYTCEWQNKHVNCQFQYNFE